MHKYETGKQVFDWSVPREWNISEAFLVGPDGETVLDIKNSNLHVVSYSTPIDLTLSLSELQSHLHSNTEIPDCIPYVTSYYKDAWGFCIPHSQRVLLKDGVYRAVIKSELTNGFVEVAEATLEGKRADTFFITKPSLKCILALIITIAS